MFDQPDLKAPMKLTVLTHDDWVAVSNSSEVKREIEDSRSLMEEKDFKWMLEFFKDDTLPKVESIIEGTEVLD